MVITPPQAQFNWQVLFKPGFPAILTVGEPGVQGDCVTGRQGMGVNTPLAAAVAAATWGFDRDVHMLKGMMFTMGICSITVPAGRLLAATRLAARAINCPGAIPKLQLRVAVVQTNWAISAYL